MGSARRKACDSDCDHDAICLDVNNTVVCPPNLLQGLFTTGAIDNIYRPTSGVVVEVVVMVAHFSSHAQIGSTQTPGIMLAPASNTMATERLHSFDSSPCRVQSSSESMQVL